jgi:murein DD-endopeptidase MepM/ murein hydrolase activator NlpD
MAFVIHSAGNLAASRVRTATARSIVLVAVVLLVVAVAGGMAGGVAVGYRLAGAPVAADVAPAEAFDPARPANRALIDRIGALSARLLRLESEAEKLGHRVGIGNAAPGAPPADDWAEPSGGPLLAPLGTAGAGPDLGDPEAIRAGLARLEAALDGVDATIALVARRTSASDLADMAYPSRYPIADGRITSGFGNRRDPFTRRLARHTGVDLPAPRGTPILASGGGTVRYADFRRAYGNSVEIDHGAGLVTRYAHASRLLVRRGQVVLPEQPIATVGSTGRSTGPHLHFEVLRNGRPVEPRRYLEAPGP